jgi:ABC-type antimicrobial peptide transport system permease subunit
MGIRIALGATPAEIARLAVSRVAWCVGLGVMVGAVLSLWASPLAAALLYGLSPRDPRTLAISALALTATGAVAAWLPAWRATRIDPATLLRER